MITGSRIGIIALVVFLCTGCDQITKGIAQRTLPDREPISLLNDVIRIEYLENHGVTLGLGATLPAELRLMAFTGAVAVFMVLLLGFLLTAKGLRRIQVLSLSLVLAGGVGNLIDRVLNDGAVIDFVSFGIGGLRTGVMNLADVAVFFGIGLLLISSATAGHGADKPAPTP